MQLPVTDNSQWASWSRTNSSGSLLQRLVGNAAYLVCVTNATGYTWKIKGRPVPPAYQWTSSGVNLIGFPTVTNGTPTIDTFLAQAPDLKNNAQIYQYKGGSPGTLSPTAVNSVLWRATTFKRGQAYWFCKTNFYNTYYGPFAVDLSNSKGVDYSDTMSVSKFHLRNLTTNSLTITVKLAASEGAPDGQTVIKGVPPLLVRGVLNATNLTYACSNLTPSASSSWKLAAKGLAGSEVDVVLGLNRTAMTGNAGDTQAGVLSFTDSLGFTKLDVPVSATVSSSVGLWVGNASITQVGEYLKSYAYDTNLTDSSYGLPMLTTNVPSTNANYGAYIVTNTTTRLGSVQSPFPLRLIVHNPSNGPAVLLQRVYCGAGPGAQTNAIVATSEDKLNSAYLKETRRISAAHLPWTAGNTCWTFSDNLDQGSITVQVVTPYDDQASNPFLHTYHPDHDNLDDTFKKTLGPGMESYTIQRDISLCHECLV